MRLSIESGNIDLGADFAMSIEESSPIFNDRGSQSLPATVPLTPGNIRLLGAPFRIDAGIDPNAPMKHIVIADGSYLRSGKVNVTSAGRREGITFNVGFDNSEIYAEWKSRKLTDLKDLPVLTYGAGETLCGKLWQMYVDPHPEHEMAIFPIALSRTEKETENSAGISITTVWWELLNAPREGFDMPRTVTRLIDNEPTAVNVPAGYMVSPFLKVRTLLELIFRDLGYEVKENPFRDDPELARLVVLNNCADACCTGTLRYKDLMPDCTVETFLHALWVRFGLVWNISGSELHLRLMKDILESTPGVDLTEMTSAPETIGYETPQYIRLSAGTSIEGAAPECERFEDFARGRDLSAVAMGVNVENWQASAAGGEIRWDGDIYDELHNDRDDYDPDRDGGDWEPPEWWDDDRDPDYDDYRDDDRDGDRDDDRDNDRDADSGGESAGAISLLSESSEIPASRDGKILAWEFVSGRWYLLDARNNRKVISSSSSFFCWDPQPEGYEALELSSEDECVAIGKVNTRATPEISFADYCPLYLTGSRHYHTFINTGSGSSAGDSEETAETPLSFMFAYGVGGKTIGRLNGESTDGGSLRLDDGSTPRYSLLFQFQDGLFATFWSRYDEILRHGNHRVEFPMLAGRHNLQSLDLLRPVKLRGVRCLIDRISYSLPGPRLLKAETTLRTIQTQGDYNIVAEQGIPDFGVSSRRLVWKLAADELEELSYSQELRETAAALWIAGHPDYAERPAEGIEDGVITLRVADSAEFLTFHRNENPGDLPEPTAFGTRMTTKLKGIMVYNIHEILETGRDTDQPWSQVLPEVIGEQRIEVDYEVIFRAVWQL